MIDPTIYEKVITDVLDTIAEMRDSGDHDENTLETLEWKLKQPTDKHPLQIALEAARRRHPSHPDNKVWYAILTTDMVAALTHEDKVALIDELDEAVARICEDYGV